jgi:hypothetical protein
MFSVRMDLSMPSPYARHVQHELRGADLIIMRRRQEGAVLDEVYEHPSAALAETWGRVRIVLDGELFVRRGTGLILRPHDAIASSTWPQEPACALTPTSEWLDLHWRHGSAVGNMLAAGGSFTVPASGRAAFGELIEAMSLGESRRAHRAAIATIDVLRASGMPFDLEAERALSTDLPAQAHAFARALERSVNGLSTQPMALDLANALGVGERQALRRASEHFRAFHLTIATWRQYMVGVRLAAGAFFSAAPGARTETVSKLVGFGSPVSFCHALHTARLPSPQELQRQYRDIMGKPGVGVASSS